MKSYHTWLLDGWLGSPWRLEWMRRNLEELQGSCRIWNYDTRGKQSLEVLARELSRELQHSPAPVHLVGFSMGGIVIREALRQQPDLPVTKMVCLNSPHQGSLPARFCSRPGLKELSSGSPFLQRLNATPCPVPLLNVWCPGDLVVIPGWNARLKNSNDATEEICSWMPVHPWPILSRSLHRRIALFLNGNPVANPATKSPNLQTV